MAAGAASRPRRWPVVVPWLLVVFAAVNGVVGVLDILGETDSGDWFAAMVESIWALSPMVWAFLGAYIVHRQPDNTIGWLMVVPVLAGALGINTAVTEAAQAPANPTFSDLFAVWYANVSWTPLIMPIFLMFALFPTGRPINERWRWHTRLVLGMWAFFLLYITFAESFISNDATGKTMWSLDNPIGILPAALFDQAWFSFGWTLGLMVSAFGGVAAMVTRIRRADWVERQQLKWLLSAVAFFATAYVVTAVAVTVSEQAEVSQWESFPVADLLLSMSILFIPVAMTIAILRYRVFDIDVIIRRTVVYALMTALLAGAYLGSVLVFRTLVEDALGTDSALGVAASTLLVAALFNPVRTRIQRVVGRRFFRGPYDAERVLAGFSSAARDQTNVELLSYELRSTVAAALRPAAIGVMLTARQAK